MRQIDTTLTRDKVVAELRREIMCGELRAGQELFQDKIADELGVSRLPVREALQILHTDGLITARPNKVATVNEISGKFLADHFDLRILLEQEAVRRVVARRIDCTALWANWHESEQAIDRMDLETFNLCNYQFHTAIWHAAGNLQMERMLARMWNTLVTDEAAGTSQDAARISNNDHRRIVECIEALDEKQALHWATLHIQRNYHRILQGLQRTPAEP